MNGGYRLWPTLFDVASMEQRAQDLEKTIQQPDFWQREQHAAEIQREWASLRADIDSLQALQQRLQETKGELPSIPLDKDLLSIVANDLSQLDDEISQKEHLLNFSGPYDRNDALITIQSGAGGTDAQDWAQMLERMYLRFAEARGWHTTMLDRSVGEEAGIKHSTFSVAGKYAYGVLRQEHGVHRLVRLSPFNADNLRQTSFARVEVLPKLSPAEAPTLNPDDLEIATFRASGAGGQHVNKTSSAVRIRHVPTGIVVQCQNERSQAQNKAQALSILQARLQQLLDEQHAQRIEDLKGAVQSAAWGNQIRSYVLHPYTLVKDHRTKTEVRDAAAVLDGDLSAFTA